MWKKPTQSKHKAMYVTLKFYFIEISIVFVLVYGIRHPHKVLKENNLLWQKKKEIPAEAEMPIKVEEHAPKFGFSPEN